MMISNFQLPKSSLSCIHKCKVLTADNQKHNACAYCWINSNHRILKLLRLRKCGFPRAAYNQKLWIAVIILRFCHEFSINRYLNLFTDLHDFIICRIKVQRDTSFCSIMKSTETIAMVLEINYLNWIQITDMMTLYVLWSRCRYSINT